MKRFYPETYEQLVKHGLKIRLQAKFSKDSVKTFESSSRGGVLQGLHTYNTLANRKYYDKYMYLPYSLKDRKTFIVSMYKDEKMK